jgi:hypothetical protein
VAKHKAAKRTKRESVGADQIMNAIVAQLEIAAEIERELKKLAKVYQLEAKLTVAKYYGLTLAQVDLPFVEWRSLRDRYEQETGKKL